MYFYNFIIYFYYLLFIFIVIREGYKYLGATSTVIANLCYLNHSEIKTIYDFYVQALQRGCGVIDDNQILRLIKYKKSQFTSHLFKLVRIIFFIYFN